MNENHASHTSGQQSAPRPRTTFLLYGHELKHNLPRAAAAEVVGTFILVLAITSAAVAATLARPVAGVPYGSLAVPVAAWLALTVLAASLGHISGAHVNPAVTLGLAANGRFPWGFALTYAIAQFVGAIAAAAVIWGLYGQRAKTMAGLGATYPPAGVSSGIVFAAEVVITFVLVLVIVSVATDQRVPPGVASIAIGAALATAVMIGGPVSGGAVNPARAIGPMILTGKFTDWWAYLVAPVVGGIVAVALYDRVLRAGQAPGQVS